MRRETLLVGDRMREVNGGRWLKRPLWTFRIWNGSVAEHIFVAQFWVNLWHSCHSTSPQCLLESFRTFHYTMINPFHMRLDDLHKPGSRVTGYNVLVVKANLKAWTSLRTAEPLAPSITEASPSSGYSLYCTHTGKSSEWLCGR